MARTGTHRYNRLGSWASADHRTRSTSSASLDEIVCTLRKLGTPAALATLKAIGQEV